MPRRGRATARHCSALPGWLRSHLGRCSWEGPRWSRDTRALGAEVANFVPRCWRPSAVCPWPRVPSSWPSLGVPPWLPHTRRAVRSPLRPRGPRPLLVVSTTEPSLGARVPSSAKGWLHGSRAPVRLRRGGGAAHVDWPRRSPPRQEPAQRSTPRPRAQGPSASVLLRVR
jgi:hypothetical protein